MIGAFRWRKSNSSCRSGFRASRCDDGNHRAQFSDGIRGRARWAGLKFLCASMLGMLAVTGTVQAEEFPSRPVRVLVGFPPGSGGDNAARLISDQLDRLSGGRFIVENRPGAGSIAAIQALKSSPADGYTLLVIAAGALVQGPGVRKDLPYDPTRDMVPISNIVRMHGVLVANPELPAKTLSELLHLAKTAPKPLTYGSSGVGMANHLLMEVLKQKTGTNMVHIPYKGDNLVALDLIAGRIDVAIQSLPTALPLVNSGKQRALAVLNMKRVPLAPDIMSLSETGVPGLEDLEPFSFMALVGPAGMPADRVRLINKWVGESLRNPDFAAKLREMGFDPSPTSVDEFQSYVAKELRRWSEIGKTLSLP